MKEELNVSEVLASVQKMCHSHKEISLEIKNLLQEIQKENVYDYVKF